MLAVTRTQQQRAQLVVAGLQQLTPEQERVALQSVGCKDRRLLKRTIETLEQYSSLTSPAKRGRPTKFTDDILQAARDEVAEPGLRLYTGRSLRDKLVEDTWLDAGADKDNLLRHLKQWCAQHNELLVPDAQGTVFCVPHTSKPERVRWCHEQLQLQEQIPLGSWIFEDKTGIEEEPHPKGECLKALAPMQSLLLLLQEPPATHKTPTSQLLLQFTMHA